MSEIKIIPKDPAVAKIATLYLQRLPLLNDRERKALMTIIESYTNPLVSMTPAGFKADFKPGESRF